MRNLYLFVFSCVVALWTASAVLAQTSQTIRIVSFNTQDDVSSPTPAGALPSLETVLEGIGQRKYVGDNVLQLPDIIALQETTSNSTTVSPIVCSSTRITVPLSSTTVPSRQPKAAVPTQATDPMG